MGEHKINKDMAITEVVKAAKHWKKKGPRVGAQGWGPTQWYCERKGNLSTQERLVTAVKNLERLERT